MRVEDIMTTEVVTVAVGESFKRVAETMLDAGVNGLPVVEADGTLVGIVTEADLVAKEAHTGHHHALGVALDMINGSDAHWWRKAEGRVAAELMSSPVVTVAPDDDLQLAARRLLGHRITQMPVVDARRRLVGIVSRADLLSVFDRADQQIRADVDEAVYAGSPRQSGDDVQVRVQQGVVTLTGTLSGSSRRGTLVGAVRVVPGVVDVIDHLGEPPGPSPHGEWILERMRHSGVGVEDPNISPPGPGGEPPAGPPVPPGTGPP